MKVIKTLLQDCVILEPKVIGDERGYFFEGFNKQTFQQETGMEIEFVQDNQSFSSRGVLRGLHAQKGQYAQAKLVRVLKGEVLDVAVDMRPESETFGKHISVLLSAENKRQLFVPRGFLHGFVVRSESAEFFYKCDNYYQKDAEWGIRFDDPQIQIDWGIPEQELIISEKDQVLPYFEEARSYLFHK